MWGNKKKENGAVLGWCGYAGSASVEDNWRGKEGLGVIKKEKLRKITEYKRETGFQSFSETKPGKEGNLRAKRTE